MLYSKLFEHRDRNILNLHEPSPTYNFKKLDPEFFIFAKHQQELEDIINMIVKEALLAEADEIEIEIEIDDNLSPEDLLYIKREVNKRLS